MKAVPVASLVFDPDIYPRVSVDEMIVTDYARAMQAGATLPHIVVDAKSKRIVDGIHRWKAHMELKREVIEVEFRTFKTEAEMYLAAASMNAGHGRRLGHYDQVRIVIHAIHDLKVDPDLVAGALGLTRDRVEQLNLRVAYDPNGALIPIKAGMASFTGMKLSHKQIEGMKKLGGSWGGRRLVATWLNAVRNDLLDFSDPVIREELEQLVVAIQGKLARRKVKA